MKLFALVLIIVCLPLHASVKLASYNIRNFDYDERSQIPTNKQHLVQMIRTMNPDLMAVQEINEKEVFDQMINRNFNGRYETVISECGGAHGQKLGFVFDQNKFRLLGFKEDLRTTNIGSNQGGVCNQGSRPLAIATFKRVETNETFIAISVHLKSGGQPKSIKKRFLQIDIIKKVVLEHRSKGYENFIIMGDFNSTEYIHRASKPHHDFKQTVSQISGVDLSSKLSCTSYWWGGVDDMTQYPSLLDHIIVSKSLLKGDDPEIKTYGHCAKLACNATSEYDMGVSFDEVSDHCPVLTELK